jgi:hypothetical protein
MLSSKSDEQSAQFDTFSAKQIACRGNVRVSERTPPVVKSRRKREANFRTRQPWEAGLLSFETEGA